MAVSSDSIMEATAEKVAVGRYIAGMCNYCLELDKR